MVRPGETQRRANQRKLASMYLSDPNSWGEDQRAVRKVLEHELIGLNKAISRGEQ